MALHTSLAIFRSTNRLIDLIEDLIAEFPRNHRSTAGVLLLANCYALQESICAANIATDKTRDLTALQVKVSTVQQQLRRAFDKRRMPKEGYGQAALITGEIARQATAWKKSS